MKNNKGFTLIELLVVVAIISLLSSVVLASLNSARAKARDAKRKQDMIQIRSALELYYDANNQKYPLPFPGYWGGVNSGTCGGNGETSGASAYITGLTPTYISVLPADSAPAANCTGYLYHSDGTSYKFLAYRTYEGTMPSLGQPFYDPVRPTQALMICGGNATACNTW